MIENNPIPPYLIFARYRSPVDRLRRRLIAVKWHQMRTIRRKAGFVCGVIGWPLIAAYFAYHETVRHGERTKELTGKGRFRQFREQWALSAWYGLAPSAYYNYSFYEDRQRLICRQYLHNQDSRTLYSAFNFGNTALLTEKVVFAEVCSAASLPMIPTLGVFKGGQEIKSSDWENQDLFAKPTDSIGGWGVLGWRFLTDGLYVDGAGARKTREQVIIRLREISKSRPYLLQPRLKNHLELQRLSPGGLCTARILTIRKKDGEILIYGALLKMPTGTALVDNFAAGGLACPIDIQSGVLGTAIGKQLAATRYTHHPDTKEPIEGFNLPDWSRTKDLCIAAHEHFPGFVYLGWDIALTDRGPILVEGNHNPGQVLFQRGSATPIGGSVFNAVCLEHLESATR